jgi:hypothetical protein
MEFLSSVIAYTRYRYPSFVSCDFQSLPNEVLICLRDSLEQVWFEKGVLFQQRHKEDQRFYEQVRHELWERRRRQKG